MSNEDSAPSPADGPAPVWLDHVGRYESRFAAVQMLRSLIAVLSPLEVVQAMGEAKGGIAKVLIPRVYEQFQVGLRATDEALARAEKAEKELSASRARNAEETEMRLGWQKRASDLDAQLNDATDSEIVLTARAEQAERERDAMYAAAEELRAQGAGLASPSGEKCEHCEGAGWLYGHELDEPEDPPTDQHYDCPTCNGTGRKTEESDGKTEEAHGGQPASATIWAEVVPEPVGDGVTDDTEALQHPANTGRWLKPGVYRVTRTLEAPPRLHPLPHRRLRLDRD